MHHFGLIAPQIVGIKPGPQSYVYVMCLRRGLRPPEILIWTRFCSSAGLLFATRLPLPTSGNFVIFTCMFALVSICFGAFDGSTG